MQDARQKLDAVRTELAWPRVVEPLARLLEGPAGRSGRPIDPTLGTYVARRLDYALASRGLAGAARRVAAIVAEQAVRRSPRRTHPPEAPLPSGRRGVDDD
jgi:hypothetical protein